MENLFKKKLVLVTGKGGVGKSTCGLAMAIAASRAGKKVLFCDLAARAAMPTLLGVKGLATSPERPKPRELPLFWAVHLSVPSAIQDYFVEVLPHKRLVQIATGNKVLTRLWKAAPSFNELVLLHSISHLVAGTHKRCPEEFDLVVVDMPASGHAITMLGVPQGITRIAKFGTIATLAATLKKLLDDRVNTALAVVTLPEELPVNESIQLVGRLKNEVGIETEQIIINGIYANELNAEEAKLLDKMLVELPSGPAKNLITLGSINETVRKRQSARMEMLKDTLKLSFTEVSAYSKRGFTLVDHVAKQMVGTSP
ncbi:MAG: AAA family ATPase [Deltaproteobacteria bacterium]|jgi:arsenite/tail-anchored protein-transporting ATPase|nr:AAA family ATPase [Deltaproteobacteria bacterium]